jgi:hypothetical protein
MLNSGLGEMFFLTTFVNGLTPEIRTTVQSMVPETMERAILLARIQTQVAERAKPKGFKNRSVNKPQSWAGKPDTRLNSPARSTLWKERQVMNYRRANNLCFHCVEPYTPAHAEVCIKNPKAQVNALVVNDLDMHLSEEVLAQLALEDSLAAEYAVIYL